MPENENNIEENEELEGELETGVKAEDSDDEPNDSDLRGVEKDDSDSDEDAEEDVEEDTDKFGLDADGEVRKPQKIDADMVDNDYKDAILVNPKRSEVQKHLMRSEAITGADFTKADEIQRVWNLLEEECGSEKPRKYNMKQSDYTENDILDHPKLGKGYILEILPNSKINVLFEMGLKKLVVNR